MLRKIFTLGALAVVAVTFGASNAMAKAPGHGWWKAPHGHGFGTDGFSDGRD